MQYFAVIGKIGIGYIRAAGRSGVARLTAAFWKKYGFIEGYFVYRVVYVAGGNGSIGRRNIGILLVYVECRQNKNLRILCKLLRFFT